MLTDDLKNSTDIAKSSEEVAAAAEELSASVEEINRSSTEIMTAIGQISLGAEQASSAVEQAVAGITQIEQGTSLAQERANEAITVGSNMQSLLTDNKVKVDEMITAINQTLETGKQNLEAIDTVEQLSREIDKVSEAIGVVAIKTAMLAVNGAVEAARAGEFGKGFAVVSDDIQNLADDAAENVEQIKDLVKDIQNQAVRVRMDLADVADASAQEAQRAQKTTTDLEQVDAEMKSLIDDSNEILDGVNEVVTAVF